MLEEKDLQAIAQLILSSEERMKGYVKGEIQSSEARMRGEIQASEERMRKEIHASENRTKEYVQGEIHASENRTKEYVQGEIHASENRTKDYVQGEVRASENRTHAFIESGVMKQVRLLAEGHEQILERLPEVDEIDSLRSRVRTLERIVTEHSQEIGALKRA